MEVIFSFQITVIKQKQLINHLEMEKIITLEITYTHITSTIVVVIIILYIKNKVMLIKK